MGLALESVIGFESSGREICMVPEWQLKSLVEISNQRFIENTKRIERFRTSLKETSGEGAGDGRRRGQEGEQWEDAQARRERKRTEGLQRAKRMKEAEESKVVGQDIEEVSDIGVLEQNF